MSSETGARTSSEVSGAFTVPLTFGQLPIGATFERDVWTRNTVGDRRCFGFQRWRYVKTTHGTIAGFADGAHGTWRAEHCWPVFVLADLRLIVQCMRATA